MEIRALRESDDRSQFQFRDPDFDRFFHKFAGQNQFRNYVGVTYVAVEDRRILGFATIAPGHVEIEDLPPSLRARSCRGTRCPYCVWHASPSTSRRAVRVSAPSSFGSC